MGIDCILAQNFSEKNYLENAPELTNQHLDSELDKLSNLHILLVEDNITNQKVALLLLQRLGYKADVANNGLEALDTLRHQTYDVVLMDVQMPTMDGLETTRCIHQEWSCSRPYIIAITANAMQGDRELCLEAGMDDYISKPIQSAKLLLVLNRYRLSKQLTIISDRNN